MQSLPQEQGRGVVVRRYSITAGLRDSILVIMEHHHQDDYPNHISPRDFDDSSPPSLARSDHEDESEGDSFSSISLSGVSSTSGEHCQANYIKVVG